MAAARIPVDLFNPGQVFACLGFMEAADALVGDAEGGFDWQDDRSAHFVLCVPGGSDPVQLVLEFLVDATVIALAPKGSGCIDREVETKIDVEGEFPVCPAPPDNGKRTWIKDSELPIMLKSASLGCTVVVSHWADVDNGRQRIKAWGGAGGKSGASRMQDLLSAVRPLIGLDPCAAITDPFGIESPVGGFRLDLHRDYVPIDIGFTLNAHRATMDSMGHPLVEVLAVIGLEDARPAVLDRLTYRYGVWRGPLDSALARPALGCSAPGSLIRKFTASLGRPNQYDRSIRHVIEEPAK
jgi:CRISPR-associated protein Csb3